MTHLPCIGQIKAEKTELTDMVKVHSWISELTSGNVIWFEVPRGEIFATQYRIAIAISDIYHTLIVEKILYGNEGCCKRVDKSWKIDLMNVHLEYGTSSEAPINLGEWLTETKPTFLIADKQFSIDLTTDDWNIALLKNGD